MGRNFEIEIENHLNEAEEFLGIIFPNRIKKRLINLKNMEVDGWNNQKWYFRTIEKIEEERKGQTHENLIIKYSINLRKDGFFPKNGVILFDDWGGDYLFLLPKENGPELKETLYLMEHETGKVKKYAGLIRSWIMF
jgi:hypothetical protein